MWAIEWMYNDESSAHTTQVEAGGVVEAVTEALASQTWCEYKAIAYVSARWIPMKQEPKNDADLKWICPKAVRRAAKNALRTAR